MDALYPVARGQYHLKGRVKKNKTITDDQLIPRYPDLSEQTTPATDTTSTTIPNPFCQKILDKPPIIAFMVMH